MKHSEKIHTLHVLPNLSFGESQNLVLDMLYVNLSEKREFQFFISYSAESTQARLNEFKKGAKVFYTPLKSTLNGYTTFQKKIRTIVRENKIEIINCHDILEAYLIRLAVIPYNLFRRFHKKRKRARVYLTVHSINVNFNLLSDFLFGENMGELITKTVRRLDRWILRRISIIFESEAAYSFYMKEYNQYPGDIDKKGGILYSKSSVVRSGIFLNRVLNAKPLTTNAINNSVVHFLNYSNPPIPSGKLLLGMIGSSDTVSVKDYLIICKSIKLLKDKYKELPFAFLFVGNIQEQEKCILYCLENDLLSQIYFMNSNTAVPDFLKSLSCYLYITYQDTFGMSVVEALISGVRVICSNTAPLTELTKNGKLATLVPNKSLDISNAIWNAVEQIMQYNLDKERENMLNIRQSAIADYSVGRCLKEYKNRYLSVKSSFKSTSKIVNAADDSKNHPNNNKSK